MQEFQKGKNSREKLQVFSSVWGAFSPTTLKEFYFQLSPNMVFSPKQESPNPSKRCKFFTSTLKDAFTNCHIFKERHSGTQSSEEDDAIDDYDEEEVFVSIVISKYIESKCRRQTTISSDKFNWTFSPTAGDLIISAKLLQQKEDNEHEEKEKNEDFFSVGTRLSRCSSALSYEAFATAKTNLSRSSSLNRIEFQDFPRRSVIQEFSNCEGWPFGLCRKLLLLPPLPKSPSDSWSWRKSARMIKIH